jgi:ATP-dependent DNA helicase PIF1
VPSNAENSVTIPFDPFEVPAYGKGPKLRFDQLDDDQKRVVNLATMERKNICCVGGAGTGKSETCEIILSELSMTRVRVAIVAASGTAAVNVRGQTIHNFFGWGADDNKGIEEFIRLMTPAVRERLRCTDTIIIDEISMVSFAMLNRMDRMARVARGKPDKPFGGMQVIVFGDFCQLPPVKPYEHCFQCGKARKKHGVGKKMVWRCPEHGDIQHSDKMWAFKSAVWREIGFVDVALTQVHRQQDPEFLAILANVRYGKPFTATEVSLLEYHPCDVTGAVELVSRRDHALKLNDYHFDELHGVSYEYECQDDFIWQEEQHPELADIKQDVRASLKDHPYEEIVYLKQGQPVILQRNIDVQTGLVNGSQGIIDHFVDYDRARNPRQSSQEDERISTYRSRHIEDFMRHQHRSRRSRKLPVVKFNNQTELVTIFPECSIKELGYEKPHSLLMRTQIPLLSGWALTIHKAQGMTLQKAIVHLVHCWQGGMAYVALSRVKTLSGLEVRGLAQTTEVKPLDDEVKAFLRAHFQANFD